MALHSLNNFAAFGIQELSWSGGVIVVVMIASLAVIGALTGPLSRPVGAD
jgi:hypothetical protein